MGEIIKEFYEISHEKTAIHKAIKGMAELCEIDHVSIIAENNETKEYEKIFQYTLHGQPMDYLDILNINQDIHVNSDVFMKGYEKETFLNLFNGSDHFYTRDFSSIENIISHMDNSITSIPYEFYAFLLDNTNFFAYISLERQNDAKSLTKAQLSVITTLLRVISSKVKNSEFSKKLENSFKMLDVIIRNESMPVALVEKDTYKVLYHNEIYKKILPDIKIGVKCYTLYGFESRCPNCYLDDESQVQRLESDNKYWIKKSTPIKLNSGKDAYMVYAKNTNDSLKQLEGLDILTNLYSLKGFNDYYEEAVSKNPYNYALCSIDIDKFKHINNISGYQFGNVILKKIAEVLKNFVNEDTERCCRINEDRFALFLTYDIVDDLRERIVELKKAFEKMQSDFFSNKKITIIGGICIIDKTRNLNLLLDQANIARKIAKGSHESRFAFYDTKLEREAERERVIEERMSSAVVNEEFTPYLQPKFDFETMTICGAEALVRWTFPEGMIYPDEFVPLFEKNGFINILDFIMYKQIMIYIRSCLDRKLNICPISVNVSRGHIPDKKFTEKFMRLIEKYNIPLDLIELEVTESIFIEDKEDLKNFIQKLKDEGLKVSIDDFGTAYSSLQTLKDINIDVLKIDKGFLSNIGIEKTRKQTKDEIVIKHIINMASDLGFDVVCEGVETFEQIEILKSIGCKVGQGYYFSRPLPIEQFEEKFLKPLI